MLRESDFAYDEASLAKALPPNLEILTLECSGRYESGLDGDFAIARAIIGLAKLKKEYVLALRDLHILTRNGVKDFTSGQAVRIIFQDSHTHEALVEECSLQGIHLVIRPLSCIRP